MKELYDLGIDAAATFVATEAITMTEAAKLIRGRHQNASREVVARFANPRKGCKAGGVKLFLPAVRYGGQLLTMPAWVAAFEHARVKLGLRRKPVFEPETFKRRERAHKRAMEALRKEGLAV